jgi:formylglycine-generating enzyme required for sulfatase activity
MSNPACYDAINRFVGHLENRGLRQRLELNDEDLADALWLALQMGVEVNQVKKEPDSTPKKEVIPKVPEKAPSDQTFEPPIDLSIPPSNSQTKQSQNEKNTEGLPFQTPTAPALQNKSQINRALRPFMRKVPSPNRRILDVEATVNGIVDALIVEQEIWLPITKPQPERWLNLELVVEQNRSSFIWQETINELQETLENYGIFRTVRSWNLANNHQGQLQLIRRKKGNKKDQCQYSYPALYHSNGRGLILIVSDCVSAIWQQQTIYDWLQKWSNQSPTAIMQLLPERLWLSTELGLGYKVRLSALNPGVPNSQLICGEDLDIKKALNLPIITLEPEYLKLWAKVVAGYGKSQTPAIVLDLDFVETQVQEIPTTQSSQTSPEAIVDLFLATASPTAQRLAGLMAAVPVSLPVVHLIQNTMLPKSTPVEVAEVFLSGMIERKKDVKNQEIYEYDFVAGVRKLLNQAMPIGETEKVLDKVSEYIAEKTPFKTFTALLLNLDKFPQEKQENLLPFARITKEVLYNLGGEYAKFANEINILKPQEIMDNPSVFEQFVGEYICAVKWGGEAGTWHEGLEQLLISPNGKVKFRSRLGLTIIESLTVAGKTISWSFEHNRTAGEITFQENSEDSYFWEENKTGNLFQGWLNYPNEGRIDFRGRLSNFEDQAFRNTGEICPADSTFVTYEEAIENRELLSRKLEDWDIAKIGGGGSMDGPGYGSTIRDKDDRSFGHSICKRLKLGVIQFTIATLERQADYEKGKDREWVINRQLGQAERIIEVLGEGIELEMIEIPPGTFLIGAPEGELESNDDERPQHEVTVPSFCMGRYPITQAQWQAVAVLPLLNQELNPDPSKLKGANRPVEQVSWDDAVEFCLRLSNHTKRQYCLPSEAEWEYACRAGTITPFHFGETITTDLANYDGNSTYGDGPKGVYRKETTEVGSFGVANNFGLSDMHGNVYEWCQDNWHDSYEDANLDASALSRDHISSDIKVLRGGSWDYGPQYCRSANRFGNIRDLRLNNIGFRVVCFSAARTL